MADFSRFVSNKLNGEWSASNVSSMLTDTILEVGLPVAAARLAGTYVCHPCSCSLRIVRHPGGSVE